MGRFYGLCLSACVCGCVYMCVCVREWVCETEREREKDSTNKYSFKCPLALSTLGAGSGMQQDEVIQLC
jgi:hypothetical protein